MHGSRMYLFPSGKVMHKGNTHITHPRLTQWCSTNAYKIVYVRLLLYGTCAEFRRIQSHEICKTFSKWKIHTSERYFIPICIVLYCEYVFDCIILRDTALQSNFCLNIRTKRNLYLPSFKLNSIFKTFIRKW